MLLFPGYCYWLNMSFVRPLPHLAAPLIWSLRPSAFLPSSPVRVPAARLICPLAMSITPSTLSRLALFLESNTFPPSSVTEYTLVPYQEFYLRQLSRMRSQVGCKGRGNSFFHYIRCVLSILVQGVGSTSPGSFACPSSGRNRALVSRSNKCRGDVVQATDKEFQLMPTV